MEKQRLSGILATIGDTPLVELQNLYPGLRARVFAKVERFNPGGSIKDRTAISIVLGAIKNAGGDQMRSVVVESSSGSLGIGLAQICRYYELELICVVDASTTELNIATLRAYGAKVEVITEPDPRTGEYLPARLGRVRELLAANPHAFWPNQYANPLNPLAHEETMREIVEALDGRVDYLFGATGTTGTLLGCGDYARRHGLSTTMVAVDAMGSALFGSGSRMQGLVPGHGASARPELFTPAVADRVVQVTDLECVVGCRMLTLREAILAGGSSGATVMALEKLRGDIPEGSVCVLIFPDGGERYLDTIYSDTWVAEQFGEVSHLWKGSGGKVVGQC